MSVNGSPPPTASPRSLYGFDGEAVGLVLCSLGGGLAFLLFVPMSFTQGSSNVVQSFKEFLIAYFSWGSSLFPLIPIAYGVVFFTGHPTRNLNRWLLSGLIILFFMLCIYEIFDQGSGGRLVEMILSWPINAIGRGWGSYILILPFAVAGLFYGIEVALRMPAFTIGKFLLRSVITFFSLTFARISQTIDTAQTHLNKVQAKRVLAKRIRQQEQEVKELKALYPETEQFSGQLAEIRNTLKMLNHQDERGIQMIEADLSNWRNVTTAFTHHSCQELQMSIQGEAKVDLAEIKRFNRSIELGHHKVGQNISSIGKASKSLEQFRFTIISELKKKEMEAESLEHEAKYAFNQLDNPSIEVLKREYQGHKDRKNRWDAIHQELSNWQEIVNFYDGWPLLVAQYDGLDDEAAIHKLASALQQNPQATMMQRAKWEAELEAVRQKEATGTPLPSLDIHFAQDAGQLPQETVQFVSPLAAEPAPLVNLDWEEEEADKALLPESRLVVAPAAVATPPQRVTLVSSAPAPWDEAPVKEPTVPPLDATRAPKKPKRAAKALAIPSLALLDPIPSRALNVTQMDVAARQRAALIESTLQSFKLQAKVVDFSRGPTVTRYEIEPAPGEKVSSFSSLANDFARALAVVGVRIEAPVSGKSVIGLEVPNVEREPVTFHQAVSSPQFKDSAARLPVILGKTIDGEMKISDLAKMPHMLIAGSTGSGKSVCVNVLIQSLLYRHLPHDLRLLMIDPKMVELTPYDGIPHLVRPVVTNPTEAAGVLLGAVAHMERRYKMMSEVGAKNLDQYNAKMQEADEPTLPYLVILIDELADLMMTSPKEVESAIMRLAQMSRATGMHLILATQRPSVDILTSLIKVNVPARAAFAVSSSHDSRTILDSIGAERLTGSGDMLFYQPGLVKPVRLQGPFITEPEINRVVAELRRQVFEDRFTELYGSDFENTIEVGSSRLDKGTMDFSDPLLRDAALICIEEGQAAVSRLQRRLRVGHSRAGSLIDMLEAMGIVGKAQGSKPREVLIGEADLPEYFGK